MVKVKAYLDDLRPMPEGFNVLWRSVMDAQEWCLEFGVPDFISFDHDMGEDSAGYQNAVLPTGFDLVKWLVREDQLRDLFIPRNFSFGVHSANPVGAKNIASYLNQYLYMRAKNDEEAWK